MQCAENVAQQLHSKSMKLMVKRAFGVAAFEPGDPVDARHLARDLVVYRGEAFAGWRGNPPAAGVSAQIGRAHV